MTGFKKTDHKNTSHKKGYCLPTVFILTLLMAGVAGMTGCSFERPAVEELQPVVAEFSKNTFLGESVKSMAYKTTDGGREEVVLGKKTFLCGWMPIREKGALGERWITHGIQNATHCNLEWKVTEKHLIGSQINPSFPNDRSRWEDVIFIPIKRHYYIEKDKDGYGREKNTLVRNSSRSDWQSRPHFELDFSNVEFRAFNNWVTNISQKYQLEDIEIDNENDFIGFTIHTTGGGWLGSRLQASYRVNFKGFTSNQNFKKIPYDDRNSKHINVLHVVGHKVDGVYPVMHTTRWDMKKRHDVYTYGVPSKYEKVIQDVIREWNETFIKIGALDKKKHEAGKAGFYLAQKELKYPMDMRYPSIYWIEDKRVSWNSPLGVGIAHADVRTGEILWGGITIFGGYIERYVKGYMPSSVNLSANMLDLSGFVPNYAGVELDKNLFLPNFTNLKTEAGEWADLYRQKLSKNKLLPNKDKSKEPDNKELDNSEEIKKLKKQIAEIKDSDFVEILNDFSNVSQKQYQKFLNANNEKNIEDYFSLPKSYGISEETLSQLNMNSQAPSINIKGEELVKNIELVTQLRMSGGFQDVDRTFAEIGPGLQAALADGNYEVEEVLQSFMKDLVLHEFGHFLGLGHQFKANILPKEGTVPNPIFSELKEASKNLQNITSVMGYRNPRTEVESNYDDLKPGPHDELVLRYMYKGEYPTYRQGDKEFTYFKVPEDGIIPTETTNKVDIEGVKKLETYPLAYFPACNDYEASFSFDPYCNRHDRGYNAESLVKNYFQSLYDSLIHDLYAFSDARGGNAHIREYYMAIRSWRTMGRIRLFYDYMRRKYKDRIAEISKNKEALLAFSQACNQSGLEQGKEGASSGNEILDGILSHNDEFNELCRVNQYAVEEMGKILSYPLTDFTKYDFSSRFTPAGYKAGDASADTSRWLGTWKELSNLPLKYASATTLTTARPYFLFWGRFLLPVFTYQLDKDAGYSYDSLYPKEVTKAISEGVESNIKLGPLSNDGESEIGRLILSMGWLRFQQRFGNDARKFPTDYVNSLRKQTQFDFKFVAVLLEGKKDENSGSDKVKEFTGTILDFRARKEIDASFVYVLPEGEVMAGSESMIIYPTTTLKFYQDNKAYVFAYAIDVESDNRDILGDVGTKVFLKELHNELLEKCIFSENGLQKYFSKTNKNFEGFDIASGIAKSNTKINDFLDSLDDIFRTYEERTGKSKDVCLETRRGQSLIVSTAAILNGYFLPETLDLIRK